ncbi:MAG: NHL repeat-containing protein [Candidatus Goldbacteria bacterium]|nr:NHL repeat-containing protein [Candidatus Goldiibacteriota bacterium]
MKKTAGIIFLILFLSLNIFVFAEEGEITVITDKPTTITYPSFNHTPFGIHRGTPFWLKVFLGNRTYFNDPQDLAATKLLVDYGKIYKGRDDYQLTVYGANSGNSEIIYNPSMYSLGIFGRYGKGDGELNRPIGIACNEYGDVYVADTGNHRISRWYNDGKKVRFIRNIGSYGENQGEFKNPRYVAIDSLGRVYVSDTGNNRVQVFDKTGGFLYMIDKFSGISNPQGIAVSDIYEKYSGYRYDYIYLIDGDYNRIQKFDFNGNLIRATRIDNVIGKQVKLTTLEQDFYGNVYVVDNKNSCVHKLTPDLFYISSFGKYGKDDYEFENPTGIAIYKHYGQIFVSDRESAQYFWVCSDAFDFKAKKAGNDEIMFEFFLTEKSFITIEVEDTAGEGSLNKKVTVCDKINLEIGHNSLSWSIPVEYKDFFKENKHYNAVLTVMSTYSSYPHIKKVIKTILFL